MTKSWIYCDTCAIQHKVISKIFSNNFRLSKHWFSIPWQPHASVVEMSNPAIFVECQSKSARYVAEVSKHDLIDIIINLNCYFQISSLDENVILY